MTSADLSALDAPWQTPPDADEFVRAAVEWHFNPETGSKFWLDRAAALDFDPRREVRGLADLARFPNVVDELRELPLQDLVPRGYGALRDLPELPLVGESGGTTGVPKRVFSLPDARGQSWSWYWERLHEHGVPTGVNWLGVVPTGPHMVGSLARDTAEHFGGIFFSIDLDPRWAKRCVGRGDAEGLLAYVEHMIDQIEWILTSQDIGVMAITPPLLEAICRREHLVEIINAKVSTITWSGASMDTDTACLLREEVFPDINLVGIFGSTMIFCGIPERPGTPADEPAIFDPPAPFSTLLVIDPDTGKQVPHGERGQVLSHHVTRNLFLPNNLERDTALRHEHRLGHPGDAVSEVKPVTTFGANQVIEGVY